MDPELDDAPELTEYYTLVPDGERWYVRCLHCPRFFSIPRGTSIKYYLGALLKHARSHDGLAGEGVDRA